MTLGDFERVANECIRLKEENKELKEVIDKIRKKLESSIESINQKFLDDKQIKVENHRVVNMNDYQIVRLKAFRTKCKELLDILKEVQDNGTNFR